jgi:hypothetical protein
VISDAMRAAMGGKDALVGFVGRIPAPIRTKLLAAFLLIELLLVALGAIGLLALQEVGRRAGDLTSLQHKIDAYRQMQHDTLRQLYAVSSALAAPADDMTLASALRQINQFGYDLDRSRLSPRTSRRCSAACARNMPGSSPTRRRRWNGNARPTLRALPWSAS